jgi:hypothetical protein
VENKRDNFKRIAEARTNKIIDGISLLGNLSNHSFYEYTDEEIEKIFAAIQAELDKQHAKFADKKKEKKNRFEL